MRAVPTLLVLTLAAVAPVRGDRITDQGPVEFKGDVFKPNNVSGLGAVGELLVIGSDEGARVQVLRREGDRYRVMSGRDLILDPSGREIDIEGVACEGDTVHVIGSHSLVRKKVGDDADYAKNRARIATTESEPSRDRVFRFRLRPDGSASDLRVTSLRPVIDADPVLRTFAAVPSKENGVDIEGVAAAGGFLYAGFRGPVLRGNYAPVLRFRFDDPKGTASLLFVNLGGRGVRDLTRAGPAFLILAGPVGDGPGSYQLYLWDGADCLPGARPGGHPGTLRLLGEVPTPDGARAEGVTVLKENTAALDVLVVYDGLKDGGARRFRVAMP